MDAEEIRVVITADDALLQRGVARAEATTASFTSRMNARAVSMGAAGRSMFRNFTVPLLGIGIAAAKASVDFQREMEKIRTQAGASQKEVNNLSKAVLNLAASGNSAMGPKVLAEGLYHIESLGFRGAAAMNVLKQAANGAAMGGANLEDTATGLGAAMAAFHDKASGAAGVMATLNAIVGAGNIRMQDLNMALSTGILPAARNFGLTLKDVGAALATMTDLGMHADEAATRLRMTLSLGAAPTKKASDALKLLGLSSLSLAHAFRQPDGLIVGMELLGTRLERIPDKAQRAAIVTRIFGGGRSSAGILTLLENLSRLQSKYQQITRQVGNYAANVAATHRTAAFKIKAAWAQIQASGVKAGGALMPVFAKLAQDLAGLTGWYTRLSSRTKHWLTILATALAVAGPSLILMGKLIKLGKDARLVILALAKAFGVELPAAAATGAAAAETELAGIGTAAAGATGAVETLRLALLSLGPAMLLVGGVAALAKFSTPDFKTVKGGRGIAAGYAKQQGLSQVFQSGSNLVERNGKYFVQSGRGMIPYTGPLPGGRSTSGAGGVHSALSENRGARSARAAVDRVATQIEATRARIRAAIAAGHGTAADPYGGGGGGGGIGGSGSGKGRKTSMLSGAGRIRDLTAFEKAYTRAAVLPRELFPKFKQELDRLRKEMGKGPLSASAAATIMARLGEVRQKMSEAIKNLASPASILTARQRMDKLKAEVLRMPPALRAKLMPEMRKINDQLANDMLTRAGLARVKARMDQIKTVVSNAIKSAQRAVTSDTGAFTSAWDRMARYALQSFDAQTQAGLEGIQDRFAASTPAEAALQALQQRKQDTDSQNTLRDAMATLQDAQQKLAAAQANGGVGANGETMDDLQKAVLDAQRQVADAQYQIQVNGLQKQASAQRQAADDQAKTEERQYQVSRDIQRNDLQQQLDNVKQNMLDRKITVADGIKQMNTIFATFGIDPSGGYLGQDFTDAFTKAISDMGRAIAALIKQIEAARKAMGLPVNVTTPGVSPGSRNDPGLSGPGGAGGGTTVGPQNRGLGLTRMASGGLVRSRSGGTAVILGEGGYDEAVVPLRGGAGGGSLTVNVTVQGSVLAERELVEKIRDGIAEIGFYNPNAFAGRA